MKNNLVKVVQLAIKNWYASLIVGILSIMLGIIFISQQLGNLVTLNFIFVLGFFIAGIYELESAINNKDSISGWEWSLASGILNLLLVILLMLIPLSTPFAITYFVGFWVLLQSIWEIGLSSNLQRIGVKDWGWLLALSVLCLLFSFITLISPIIAPKSIVYMVAFAFISNGIFRIYLSVKLKSINDELW